MSGGDRSDPSELQERRSNIYVSKRDLAFALIGLALVLAVFGLLYQNLKRQAETSICLRNMNQISKAISLYLEANNDRFPPAYATDEEGWVLFEHGYPVTWMSLLRDSMSARTSFRCPTAEDSEVSMNYHAVNPTSTTSAPKAPAFPSTYGYYLAREFYELNRLAYPSEAVLVAETSNRGAADTFDPRPLKGADGRPLRWDGFAIGWDDSNVEPGQDSRFVTRLAFPESAGGRFKADGKSRHANGIHIVRADGGAGTIRPDRARIERIGNDIAGLWAPR